MELEQLETPQKPKVQTLWAKMMEKSGKYAGGEITPVGKSATAAGKKSQKKLHPRTPNGSGSFASSSTSSGNMASCTSSCHFFSQSSSLSLVGTPPAKRFQRVRNPFEAALSDRLHLPLIGSPSLFQRPATPQLSSTQFEWTIDEVSSIKPTHLEPHETQFQDSPDPDYEAKAQSAISSYFKEQQIVPSPVDCPLRNQRIILSELNGNTPISKPGRRIRDCATQTALTLPPVLPPGLEEALRPYLQPHLAVSETYLEQSRSQVVATDTYLSSSECKDVSLRRKLFDIHNVIVVDSGEQQGMVRPQQTNSSPLSVSAMQYTAIMGKLSDSLDQNSFGSLSPISGTTGGLSSCSLSPLLPEQAEVDSAKKRKSRLRSFMLNDVEHLSPIHPPTGSAQSKRKSRLQPKYRTQVQTTIEHTSLGNVSPLSPASKNRDIDKFTPDRSSSPMLHSLERAELSTDSSFNYKISRLVVNSAKCGGGGGSTEAKARSKLFSKSNAEIELFAHDDTDELLEGDDDDNDMQVSQLSGQSSNCSSTDSHTPRGRRRSASRKNLSQSFSANWLEEAEEAEAEQAMVEQIEEEQMLLGKVAIPKINLSLLQQQLPVAATNDNDKLLQEHLPKTGVNFYRTDSGFNEMTNSSCSSALQQQQQYSVNDEEQQDVNMVCCSTPSKCIARSELATNTNVR